MSEGVDRLAVVKASAQRFGRSWGNLLVFTVIGAALLGAVVLIFQTIDAERHERDQVQRTNLVLLQLRNISRDALSAETGQRGYVITLDRRYLGPYLAAKDTYRPAIERLRELLGPQVTTRQSELLDQIQTLADAKFAEMEQTVSLVDSRDVLGAKALILSDEGLESMGRLRLAIREMEDIEQQQLSTATADTAKAEGRVLPLLSGLLALLIVALALAYMLVGRTARAEAEAAQAGALAEARDRADLLARELNHRVKNLFAVILAIVRMSARNAPEAKEVTDTIADRIHALLTAHEVTQGQESGSRAQLRELVETTVRPYLTSEREVHVDGDAIELEQRQVTPLGLVLHELTTNAVKYGCWSVGGLLTVQWQEAGGDVTISWIEQGMAASEHREGQLEATPSDSDHKGFGTMLMGNAARQLNGSIERDLSAEGLRVAITFPHKA